MKKFTVLLALLSLPAMAQTKLISHKSHSGSMATFTTAFNNNLFDIGESDFGAAPYRQVKAAQLDSVIFINPATAIMVKLKFVLHFISTLPDAHVLGTSSPTPI